MICPHCGSAILIDANFCPRCGTNLRDENATRPASTQSAEESNPSKPSADAPPTQPVQEDAQPDPIQSTAFQSATSQSAIFQSTSEQPVDLSALTAIPGLIDPVRIGGDWSEETPIAFPSPTVLTASPDDLRRIRQQMQGEATLVQMLPSFSSADVSHRVRWIFALLALAVLLPAFLGWTAPAPASSQSDTSNAFYQQIELLPTNADVLVFWAYDAATAGEMDRIALPVLRHLLTRQARSTVVTLLPGGVPIAGRLYQQVVRANPLRPDTSELGLRNALSRTRFLPGGVTALPSLGLCVDDTCPYKLVLVVAAQAEDVQHWLELVQPIYNVPVIALASAAAGPMLRPYRESEQLAGLLSGFDGAASYAAEQGKVLLTRQESAVQQQHLAGQSWGTLALLVVLLVANLLASGNVREEA